MRPNGWQRLWVVLSGIGLAAALGAIVIEFRSHPVDPAIADAFGDTRCAIKRVRDAAGVIKAGGVDAEVDALLCSPAYDDLDPRLRAWEMAARMQSQRECPPGERVLFPDGTQIVGVPANASVRDVLVRVSGRNVYMLNPDHAPLGCQELVRYWGTKNQNPPATRTEYERLISEQRLEATGRTALAMLSIWLGISALIYAAGFTTAWVRRGFQKPGR